MVRKVLDEEKQEARRAVLQALPAAMAAVGLPAEFPKLQAAQHRPPPVSALSPRLPCRPCRGRRGSLSLSSRPATTASAAPGSPKPSVAHRLGPN